MEIIYLHAKMCMNYISYIWIMCICIKNYLVNSGMTRTIIYTQKFLQDWFVNGTAHKGLWQKSVLHPLSMHCLID